MKKLIELRDKNKTKEELEAEEKKAIVNSKNYLWQKSHIP